MAATIKIKNSSTTGSVPSASNLVQGELAVNVTDLGLYTENASGTVVKLNAPSIDDKNTGATKHLTIDTSGNMGLGVTPSAWGSGFKAIDVNTYGAVASSTSALRLFANSYNDGTNWTYKTTAAASRYDLSGGAHAWLIAASGTAGNSITFTQAMTLDASGNLGVGTTSPVNKIHVVGSATTNVLRAQASSSGDGIVLRPNAAGNGGDVFSVNSAQDTYTPLNLYGSRIVFGANGTESARINSSGQLLVGTTSGTDVGRVVSAGVANSYPAYRAETGATTSQQQISFVNPNGVVGTITTSGSATAYNTSSDYRLKNITGSLTGYKQRLLALQPKQGSWKVDGSEFRGFLAHEFAESYPASVSGEKDAVDANGNPQHQGMQAGSPEVIADLVAYIKELETRLTALEQA